MPRKRAPGGGRKSKGPFTGKTTTLTTRITPETRRALDREAKKSGRSLSQEVEDRLNKSLHRTGGDIPSDIRALAYAITLLAYQIELRTSERWIQDPFTGEALRHGIDFMVTHFAPPRGDELTVPPKVRGEATKLGPELGELYLSPEWLGRGEAGMAISSIEGAIRLPPLGTKVLPGYSIDPWGFEQIRRDLGSGLERRKASYREKDK